MRHPEWISIGFRTALLTAVLVLWAGRPAQARQVHFAPLLSAPAATSASDEVSPDDQPAAPTPRRFGIGGLAGRTSGLTVRVLLIDHSRRSGPFEERAVDVNASFNLDGYLSLTAHVTAERPVEHSPLTFYIGPGWLAGADDGEGFFGVSGNIGVYFTMAHYQILLQLMPGIRLTPDVDGDMGAAVGMRVNL